MGKVILVIVLIVVAFVIYKSYQTPMSAEEMKVKAIEDTYLSAVGKVVGAGGADNAIGIDALENAVAQVRLIRNDLARVRAQLRDGKAIRRAQELSAKIEEFCRKNDIR
jgi:triacylglycerol esterase/lipase EstA (alpha/beta hydrolase family)